jgi:uncharacterized protein (TIGR03067 family)
MLHRNILAAAVLAACATLSPSAPAPKYRAPKTTDAAEVLKKLQGTWEMTYNYNEQPVAGARLAAVRAVNVARSTTQVRIQGSRWSYVRNLRGEERIGASYNVKLDPSKKPMWLDLVRDGTAEPTMVGIVSIEGDTVQFCYGSGVRQPDGRISRQRPTAFASDENGYQMMMTLRRVAP